MARKWIAVDEGVYKAFKERVRRLYGRARGNIGYTAGRVLGDWLEGVEPGTIHTQNSMVGQSTLNPGLVIPELAGLDRRRAAVVVKVLEALTQGGKFMEPTINRNLIRNVAGRHVSNYYSIRGVTDFVWHKLTEDRGGRRVLKVGVSERIREAMGFNASCAPA